MTQLKAPSIKSSWQTWPQIYVKTSKQVTGFQRRNPRRYTKNRDNFLAKFSRPSIFCTVRFIKNRPLPSTAVPSCDVGKKVLGLTYFTLRIYLSRLWMCQSILSAVIFEDLWFLFVMTYGVCLCVWSRVIPSCILVVTLHSFTLHHLNLNRILTWYRWPKLNGDWI